MDYVNLSGLVFHHLVIVDVEINIMENYSINNCYNIDSDAIKKLKERVISYFNKLLCLTEKGYKPNYEFILEIISLIDLYEHKLVEDRDKLLFVIQYSLHNKWQKKHLTNCTKDITQMMFLTELLLLVFLIC